MPRSWGALAHIGPRIHDLDLPCWAQSLYQVVLDTQILERAERLGPRVSASAALSLGRLGESGSNGDKLSSWREQPGLGSIADSNPYFQATFTLPVSLAS